MAAGPVVGAAILSSVHPAGALAAAGLTGTAAAILDPAWRWVFYINIPIGIIAIVLALAASTGWETPRRPGRVDIVGAALFGVALVAGLIGLTLLGSTEIAGTSVPPAVVTAALLGVAAIATRWPSCAACECPTRSSTRGSSGACRSARPRSSRC